jgi:hypothetical protein
MDYLKAAALSMSYFYFDFRLVNTVLIRFFAYYSAFRMLFLMFCSISVHFSVISLTSYDYFFLIASSLLSMSLFLLVS